MFGADPQAEGANNVVDRKSRAWTWSQRLEDHMDCGFNDVIDENGIYGGDEKLSAHSEGIIAEITAKTQL